MKISLDPSTEKHMKKHRLRKGRRVMQPNIIFLHFLDESQAYQDAEARYRGMGLGTSHPNYPEYMKWRQYYKEQ